MSHSAEIKLVKYFITGIMLFVLFVPVISQEVNVPNRYKQDEYAIHFGFCLGLNMMNFKVTPDLSSYRKDSLMPSVTNPSPGFNIQIISNYRLGEYLDLRFLPGIAFGQRTLDYYNNKGLLVNSKHQLESNYLEFPLLLKYKAKRKTNIRPYVVTGLNCRYDLAHNYNEDQQVYLDLKRFGYYYEVGSGIDFYLEFFKLSVELKFSYGFNDILKRRSNIPNDDGSGINPHSFQNAIQRLGSTLTMLSFHFE